MADNTETLGLRLHADGVVATSNGVKVAGDAIADLGKKADKAAEPVARVGKTSKETAAAMRLLPAQITDVVTSLAGGQPVWLVAIQQGGQIKDSFGGIGPTFRALTSAINPLTAGLMGLGAVGAVAVAAFSMGQREALGYRREIVMTGNAAGTTVDRLQDMAQGLDAIIGTERQAADALTQLVSTTQVSGNQLMQFAEVAIRMEKVTGQSIDKTVAQFAELGKNPVQAALKLNETTNFLTRSVYDQIKALQEQKKYSEAAAVAQQAYADTIGGRLKTLEGNLGTLERAWNFVKTAAAEGWDAMLGMGREASIGDKLKTLQKNLDFLNSPDRKSQDPRRDEQRKAAIMEQMEALRETARMADSYAQRQAEATRRDRDYIKAQEEKKQAHDEGKSAYERLLSDIAKADSLAREELTTGARLTEAEKFRVNSLREIAEAEKALGPVRAQKLRDMAATTTAVIEELDWVRQANEYQQEHEKRQAQQREQKLREAQQGVETLKRERDAMYDQIAAIGANSEALAMREVSLNNAAVAQRQVRLAQIEGLPAYAAETAALREQIDLLNEKSALTMRKFRAQTADDERKANEKRTQDLATSIEEGIFNGFREGGKIADVFLRELKAQFARTVLRAPVQMIAQGGSDMLGKLFNVIGNVFGNSGNTDANYPTDNTGARAWGGDVEPGASYLVGEKGPEVLRMGRQRGTVIPNHELGRASAARGPQITFAPQIHIDSRTDRAEVMGLVGRAMRSAQAEMLEMMERRMA